MTGLTPEREQEARDWLAQDKGSYVVSNGFVHPIFRELLAEIDRLRADQKELCDHIVQLSADLKRLREAGDALADAAHLYVANPVPARGEPLGRGLAAWRAVSGADT